MDERTKINHIHSTSRDERPFVSELDQPRIVPPGKKRKPALDLIILIIAVIAAIVFTIIMTSASWIKLKF
jgi:hypothetical protein